MGFGAASDARCLAYAVAFKSAFDVANSESLNEADPRYLVREEREDAYNICSDSVSMEYIVSTSLDNAPCL